ncbi:glycosyltransferase [Pseudoalteromonas lipolytica]|uniref:glycosyltransferase n=1 Tax=Pseudoalteromonas lipolytica TaxID=570156 RepID=UPI00309EF76D
MFYQVLISDFLNDNRVEKTTESLNRAGVDMKVLCLGREGVDYPKHEYEVKRVYLLSQNWSKFFLIQIFKFLELIFKMCLYLKKNNARVLHCNDLGGLIVGFTFKLFLERSVKLIYDSHEFQTEVHGLSKNQKKMRKFLESLLIKKVAETITVSESIALAYQKDYSIAKPVVIYNVPYLAEIKKNNKLREVFHISETDILFIYQGLISKARGVKEIAEGFMSSKNQAAHVVFMGNGPYVNEIKSLSEECHNIHYHPPVKKEELLNYSSSADFGIHLIPNTCLNHDYCMPNKLFEYLSSSLPLVVSDVHDMSNFVIKNEIGVVIKSERFDIDTLLLSIDKDKINHYKNNCKKLSKIYNWEQEEVKLLSIYNRLGVL